MPESDLQRPEVPAGGTLDRVRLDRLRSVAATHYEKWAANLMRSGAVCRARGGTDGMRRLIDRRLELLLGEANAGFAVRRWLLETIANWAPLAVAFSPRPPQTHLPGVSGVLSVHAQEILEKAYSHFFKSARSAGAAIELLAADVQQYEVQIEVSEALGWMLCEPEKGETLEWVVPLKGMSLAMGEYLHRQTLGIAQVLPESMAMSYAAQIAGAHREFFSAPLRCPLARSA